MASKFVWPQMALARRHMASLATKNTEISVPQVEVCYFSNHGKLKNTFFDVVDVCSLYLLIYMYFLFLGNYNH